MITSLRHAAALWSLGRLRGDELPPIAADALMMGEDSESLRILAGLNAPTADEAGPVFKRALADMGIPIPEESEAVVIAAQPIAAQIVDGRITPYDGARKIWSLWCPGFPDPLLVFVGAASQIDDFLEERASDPPKYDRWIKLCEDDIRAAARALLGDVAA